MVLTPLTPTVLSGFTYSFPSLTVTTATLSGRLTAGSGDEQQLFIANQGQYIHALAGTSSAPDKSANPLIKATRTVALPASLAGNVGEYQAAIAGICVGVTGNAVQVTGIAGIAINRSATVDTRNDSGGGYFFAWQDVDTTNASEAIFAATKRTYANSLTESIEVQTQNFVVESNTSGTVTVTIASPSVFSKTAHGFVAGDQVAFTTTGALPTGLTASRTYYVIATGLTPDAFEVSLTLAGSAVNTSGSQSGTHTVYLRPGSAYSQQGYADAIGIGLSAGSSSSGTMVGCGLLFARADAPRFDVGIGVPAFANQGDGMGPIYQATLRDDGSSLYSILVKGSHATAAIAVADAAGGVVVGATAPVFSGGSQNSRLELWTTTGTASTGLLTIGEQGAGTPHTQGFTFRNPAGSLRIAIAAVGALGVGSLTAGDGVIQTTATGSAVHLAGSTTKIVSVSQDDKLGFFATAPAARPSAYTQTYSTASRTVNPASTSAFTGQDNAQAGTVYAKVADLNQLRTDLLALAQNVNSVIDDGQTLGLLQ